MPDYMTTVTADEAIKKVTRKEFESVAAGLGYDPQVYVLTHNKDENFYSFSDNGTSAYTVEWSPKDRELYIFAEDNASTGDVPEAFWVALGKVLTAKKMDFLGFGFAAHCSKPCVGSFGGGEFRVYRDGRLKYANIVHPKYKIKNA